MQKEDIRPVMSREQSDGEDSVGENGTDRFVDATAEMEVELRLPLEVDTEPDRMCRDGPIFLGAVNLDAVDPGQEKQRRFEPPNGPNRSGPDTGCRYPALRNPVGLEHKH